MKVSSYKEWTIAILVSLFLVFGARRYTLNWAVEQMDFGCHEAALKEYRFFSVKDGNELDKFCIARRKMVEEEFRW